MFRPLLSNPRALRLFTPSFKRSLTSETPGSTQYAPRRERWITPTMLLVGFIPVLSFGLGTWQLQRLQWKTNLIDELQEKLQLDPLSLPPQIKCGNR
jgi:surfeit locus 1 family protein